MRLLAFEPDYPLAEYKSDGVRLAEVVDAAAPWEETTGISAAGVPDPRLSALRVPLDAWVSESEAKVKAVAVAGGIEEAIGAIGLSGPVSVRALTAQEAMARLAFAGASAGAHGRRRGAAIGRSAAWFALAGLAGLEWPPEPGDLERAIDAMEFAEWDGHPGWTMRLAITVEDTTMAVVATEAD